ncbi:MAG TPA: Ig-like domain-containing protein [Planctomycetota bacterium]|nr:Ig-like domain-containing protein [Planctomycetota bacterium]
MRYWDAIIKAMGVCLLVSISASGAATPPRVWVEPNPLYDELIIRGTNPWQKLGNTYYAPGELFYRGFWTQTDFAHQFGRKFSCDELVKFYAQNGNTLTYSRENQLPDFFLRRAQALGIQPRLIFELQPSEVGGNYLGVNGRDIILDPQNRQAFLDKIRIELEQKAATHEAFYLGDETIEQTVYNILLTRNAMRSGTLGHAYPWMASLDDEIKTRFGFGKYGLPDYSQDPRYVYPPDDAFRRIAFYRWLEFEFAGLAADVRTIMNQKAPGKPLMSWDYMAGETKDDPSLSAPSFDIMIGQLFAGDQLDAKLQHFTYYTKRMADLSGKSVMPWPHLGRYYGPPTAQEAALLAGEILRGGGSGFTKILQDWDGQARKGFPAKDDNGNYVGLGGWHRSSYYGDPIKFDALRKVEADIQSISALKMPQDPDSLILCSTDTLKSHLNPLSYSPVEMAFTYLGPVCRTWFKIASDNMIEKGQVRLSDYRAVFVPWAEFQRKKVVELLTAYVQNGGTLVIGDPRAFTFDLDGTNISPAVWTLLGAQLVYEPRGQTAISLKSTGLFSGVDTSRNLSVGTNTCHYFVPQDTVEVLGTYTHNGKPAIIMHKLGLGRVLGFGASPFSRGACANPVESVSQTYRALFKVLCRNLALKGDRDIWRFQMPMPPLITPPTRSDLCLTNNNLEFENDAAVLRYNRDTGGSYSYSIAPDSANEAAANTPILFSQGKLTNRCDAVAKPVIDHGIDLKTELDTTVPRLTAAQRNAIMLAGTSNAAKKWLVYWTQTAPLDITVDLKVPYDLTAVRIFSQGTPAMTLFSSVDGQAWKTVGSAVKPANVQPEDVNETSFALGLSTARFVKIRFDQRAAGERLLISELDVWGNVALAPSITSPLLASGTVGQSFQYQIAASNRPTSFSATGLPSGLSINTSTGLISGIPTASGSSSVTISATNPVGTDTKVLQVSVQPANRPPVANAQTVKMPEDTPTKITLTGTDADGDALKYSLVTLPSRGTLSGTAPNLIYTPAQNYFGMDGFTFKINDGKSDSNVASVFISVTAVNDPPIIISGAWVDTALLVHPASTTVHVIAADPEGDALTYAWSQLSGTGTATFTTPGAADSAVTFSAEGNYNLNVTVSDSKGGSTSSTIAIAVLGSTQITVAAPTIGPSPAIVYPGPVQITIQCSSPHDAIFYTLNNSTPIAGVSTTCFRYAGPFTISASTPVRAIAVLSGVKSAQTAAWYTIQKPPVITLQPRDTAVQLGQIATFEINSDSTSIPWVSYQWFRRSGQNAPVVISGATKRIYSKFAQSTDNGCTFFCVVKNATGSATSREATLTVLP